MSTLDLFSVTPSETADLLPRRFRDWFAARGWSPREHQLALLAKASDDASALLIAPTTAAAPAEPPPAAAVTLDEALQKWSYDALYTLLTHEARERFGLIKGYRLILEIEGVSNLAGLQAVAQKFVDQIRKAHGEDSAARFRRQLGATA